MQVHGDVFRPPQSASLLSTYVGVGVQIFGMLVITTVFALLGFLSPANRGGLMTAMVLMFVFMGLLAGYTAGRVRLLSQCHPSLPRGGGQVWGCGPTNGILRVRSAIL
jgi:hypothetical protein